MRGVETMKIIESFSDFILTVYSLLSNPATTSPIL